MVAGLIVPLMLIAAANPPPTMTFNGIQFGKQEIISGIWFTNFENNRFLRCDGSDCDGRPLSEWSAIECRPKVCAELDAAARIISGQPASDDEAEGTFHVRFEGRVGLKKYPSRFIGDGHGRVLMERLVEVK